MRKLYFENLILSALFVFGACAQSDEQRALDKAERYPHLQKCLELYSHDTEKFNAVCFLLANVPDRDVSLVWADSIKNNVDAAYATWEKTPWASEYSQDQFFNYVLPPQVSSEPLEYYWRQDCPLWMNIEPDGDMDMMALAKKVNSRTKYNGTMSVTSNGLNGYTTIRRLNSGMCDDRALLCVMAMRSMGIPAAYEFIPQRGSMNIGHSMCSVILPDGGVAVFQGTTDDGEHVSLGAKTPKIYRSTFAEQRNSILYKHREKECIPSLFSDFKHIDVTALHHVGQRDVSIALQTPSRSKIVYLSLFTPVRWNPIAYTERRGNSARFDAVGTGPDGKGKLLKPEEGIGDGILYLPCYYIDNQIIPASDPVVVSKTAVRSIVPDTVNREKIVLTRKYPRIERIVEFAREMVGGVFEGASRSDFSDAQELALITDTPISRMQRIGIQSEKPFRFVRYRKPQGTFSLGEIRVLDTDGQPISAEPVCCETISGLESAGNMYDGYPLTFCSFGNGLDLWAGVKLNKPSQIGFIEFCPRNDDNEISPGDIYELMYWDGAWKSLGRQKAAGYHIEYANVPGGALLWLKNHTRGKEERPFTWENGQQVWW